MDYLEGTLSLEIGRFLTRGRGPRVRTRGLLLQRREDYMIDTENASIIQDSPQTLQQGSQLAFTPRDSTLVEYIDEILRGMGGKFEFSGREVVETLGIRIHAEGKKVGVFADSLGGKLLSPASGQEVGSVFGYRDGMAINKLWQILYQYLTRFPRYERDSLNRTGEGKKQDIKSYLLPTLGQHINDGLVGNRISDWFDGEAFVDRLEIVLSQQTRHSRVRATSNVLGQELTSASSRSVALFLGLQEDPNKLADFILYWNHILMLICGYRSSNNTTLKEQEKEQKQVAKDVLSTGNESKSARTKEARDHVSAVFIQCSAVGKRSARDGRHSEYFYMVDRTPQGNKAIELFACAKELQENALRDIASGLRLAPCPYGKTREECSEMAGAIGDACRLDDRAMCSMYKHSVYAYKVIAESEFSYLELQKVLNFVIEEQKAKNTLTKRPKHIRTLSDDLQEPVRFRHPAPDYKRGTPRWNEILTRCSCPITLVCWIAKLFIPDDRSRRALYLRGTGKTGNTTIVNALNNYINAEEAELAGQITFDQDDASTFKVQQRAGKLLAVCGDTGNIGLFKTTAFKGITGDEQKAGEHKHGAMTTVDTYCKLIVTSNHLINIDPLQTASHSRVAYVTLKRVPDSIIADQNVVVADLVAELPLFVKNCREFWEREIKGKGLAPDGEVPVTKATAERMRELEYDSSKDIRDILHTCVVLAAPGETNKYKRKKVKPSGSKRYVDDDSFQEILIPASITQEDIIELYMSKSTVDQDVAIKGKDSAVANIFDYIERLYGVQKEVRSFMLPDGMAIYIEGIFGIKLVETPVQKVEITGLEIKEIDKDYGVYVGPVRYRQQLQLPKHTEQDIWGDFL
jgi:hypothetical protein